MILGAIYPGSYFLPLSAPEPPAPPEPKVVRYTIQVGRFTRVIVAHLPP